jgi:thiosulfate/3-mercaptopyruvate sulfurtransferase
MYWAMTPIIEISELIGLLGSEQLVLVDASSGKVKSAEAHYLEGAIYVDMDKDLADVPEDPALGGRHPLPSLNAFSKTLGRLGIGPETRVVVYDDKGGANAAARFWWMLRAIGHQGVHVLNGGQQAGVAAGLQLLPRPALPRFTAPYPIPSDWLLPTATMDEVAELARDPQGLVVDVRDAARYRGEVEPIDLVAGHIPGAVNIPFSENFELSTCQFKSPVELRERYESVFAGIPTHKRVVHCGSGVTACHTLLALSYAGLDIPKLYVGSWSEWSRNLTVSTA